MQRFVRDPRLREFQGRLRDEAKRIGAKSKGLGFVIYAICDPTKNASRWPDLHGPPIYIGQSKQLHVRANDHMRDGGGGSQDRGKKTGRLKQIVDRWVVPRFEILDTAPTHLTSLIAETVWARRFVWLGYELSNSWPEHKKKEVPAGLRDVPLKRLWNLTVGEAVEDEVSVHVGCAPCGYGQPVVLDKLRPEVPLYLLKSLKLRCPECGGQFVHVRRPDPDKWKWASYTVRPMPPRGTPLGLPASGSEVAISVGGLTGGNGAQADA